MVVASLYHPEKRFSNKILKMNKVDTNLESEKIDSRMNKRKKQRNIKTGYPPELSEVQQQYRQVLETELREQHLRVLLYQNVLAQVSEELGLDALKKIGGQQSGP